MAKINPWLDIHRVAASKQLNKPIEEVTEEERATTKGLNFMKMWSRNSSAYFKELDDYILDMAEVRSDAFEAVEMLKAARKVG